MSEEAAPQPDSPALATRHLIESLLFVTEEPVSIEQLAQALDMPAAQVESALQQLGEEYQGRGIRLQRHKDRLQLVTAPEAAPIVARFLGVQGSARLSSAALEVLAIVAYRQPLTRSQLETIRGVDSSGVLRALISRNLIAEVGRLDTVGRPILYATTPEFLQQFGLDSLDNLPPLPEYDDPIPESPPPESGSER